MIYNLIVVIASIAAAMLIIKTTYKKEFSLKNKIILIELIALLVGFSIRMVGIQYIPNALNVDEASAGYEAFSILNYGIDRHGNHLPVFLEAWGSGQNALLTYLMIPFIKIMGLNILSIRMPMAIIGCISLILMYLILKRTQNSKVATVGLIFFAICPWHIMKSRWGLESNIFPDIILLFVYMIIRGIQDKNKIIYYSAYIIAGLSAYAYGTSYFFLPILIIAVLIILLRRKEITIRYSNYKLIYSRIYIITYNYLYIYKQI